MAEIFIEREMKRIPIRTTFIAKHNAVEGPFSSNYCAPFTGILLETRLSSEGLSNLYPNTKIAWFEEDTVTLNLTTEGPKTFPYNCNTCFPKGVKKLFGDYQSAMQSDYGYVVIFENGYYTSKFDFRCN